MSTTNVPYTDLSRLYVPPISKGQLTLAVDGKRLGFFSETLSPSSSNITRLEAGSTYWLSEVRDLSWDWNNEALTGWQHETAQGKQTWRRRWMGQLGWKPKAWLGSRAMDWHAPDASTLILAGIDENGVLHRSELTTGSTSSGSNIRTTSTTHSDRLTGAIVILKSNLVAAVLQSNLIIGYRSISKQLMVTWSIETLKSARPIVNLVRDPLSKELVAIHDDGSMTHVPLAT